MKKVKVATIETINEAVKRLSEQDPDMAYEEVKQLLIEQEAAYRTIADVLKALLEQCPE